MILRVRTRKQKSAFRLKGRQQGITNKHRTGEATQRHLYHFPFFLPHGCQLPRWGWASLQVPRQVKWTKWTFLCAVSKHTSVSARGAFMTFWYKSRDEMGFRALGICWRYSLSTIANNREELFLPPNSPKQGVAVTLSGKTDKSCLLEVGIH